MFDLEALDLMENYELKNANNKFSFFFFDAR